MIPISSPKQSGLCSLFMEMVLKICDSRKAMTMRLFVYFSVINVCYGEPSCHREAVGECCSLKRTKLLSLQGLGTRHTPRGSLPSLGGSNKQQMVILRDVPYNSALLGVDHITAPLAPTINPTSNFPASKVRAGATKQVERSKVTMAMQHKALFLSEQNGENETAKWWTTYQIYQNTRNLRKNHASVGKWGGVSPIWLSFAFSWVDFPLSFFLQQPAAARSPNRAWQEGSVGASHWGRKVLNPKWWNKRATACYIGMKR